MYPRIYQVQKISNGILSIMAKPVAGEWIEEEFCNLKKLGIDKIVSLLEKNEEIEVGLNKEYDLCLKNNLEFENFPIPDRGIPKIEMAKQLTNKLHKEIIYGKHVVIHCRAGIGISGIIVAAILKEAGSATQDAIKIVSEARGIQIPDTIEQEKWLGNY